MHLGAKKYCQEREKPTSLLFLNDFSWFLSFTTSETQNFEHYIVYYGALHSVFVYLISKNAINTLREFHHFVLKNIKLLPTCVHVPAVAIVACQQLILLHRVSQFVCPRR